MKALAAAALFPVPMIVLLGAAFDQSGTPPADGVDAAALPAAARELLPVVDRERALACPELPLVWLAAQIQAESGWDPFAYSTAGAAGLLQFMPASWSEASGRPAWPPGRPPAGHPVWDPVQHLRAALPWMCENLRLVVAHLAASAKPTAPLDALAVCHIAGCSRVTGSRTGVPEPGEAGCDASCAAAVRGYLDTIHSLGQCARRGTGASRRCARAVPGWPHRVRRARPDRDRRMRHRSGGMAAHADRGRLPSLASHLLGRARLEPGQRPSPRARLRLLLRPSRHVPR